jgi:hypothetical protein
LAIGEGTLSYQPTLSFAGAMATARFFSKPF